MRVTCSRTTLHIVAISAGALLRIVPALNIDEALFYFKRKNLTSQNYFRNPSKCVRAFLLCLQQIN